MPYEIAIPPIETALRALLVAYTPLTTVLASKPTARGGGPAIYNDGDVPQGATLPYLTLGAWTQVGSHSFTPNAGSPDVTGYGWNCTGQFTVVGQKSATWDEPALMAVMSHVFAALPHGMPLSVAGYGSGWVDEFTLQPTLKELINGVTTFRVPAILRVYVHDV